MIFVFSEKTVCLATQSFLQSDQEDTEFEICHKKEQSELIQVRKRWHCNLAVTISIKKLSLK